MNLAALLVRAGGAHRDRPALALGDRVIADYGALAERVARLAAALRDRLGLEAGDRVALAMSNGPAYVELLFACWHAGLAAVPMNAKLHPKELAFMLDHSGAKVCFATAALADALAEVVDEVTTLAEIIRIDGAVHRRLFDAPPRTIESVAPDDLAWLFYTSGTTGRPKGAMLSHRNLLAMTLSYFVDVDAIAPEDCILHAAPMSHGSGLYILPHVAAGALNVVPESAGFDPPEVLALSRTYPGMTCFFAPTMVKRLVEHPDCDAANSRLKTIVYGGGPMYVEDVKRAMAAFGQIFVQIYGQGESPMTITSLPRGYHGDHDDPRHEARLASVGRAQSVVEVRVAGAEDQALPPGTPGEILVRGDSVMLGYWRDPEATAASLRGGWLHTGDVGVLDEDGFLTLMDRSKDLIISGGSNIYPREVEEVLLAHPSVSEAAVIGVPDPDWGEVVVAVVVLRPGAEPDEDSLDALCLSRLARFKRPKRYRFVESLPKNNYGKIVKTALREG